MATTNSKYFIAILPTEPIFSQIVELKSYIAHNYYSKAALNSPPHLTLHMPFEFNSKKNKQLYSTLNQIALSNYEFTICLNNFSFFEPKVVFIAVEKNDFLNNLHFQIKENLKLNYFIFNANYKNRIAFNPHVTIGFRDLKKEYFYLAKNYFETKEFQKKILVNSFFLLEKKENFWVVKKEFIFANK